MPENMAEEEATVETVSAETGKPVMSELEYNIWALLFKIMRFDVKFLGFLEEQSKKAEPPAFLNEPFYVGIFPRWANFETMRADYIEAERDIVSAYNKRKAETELPENVSGGIHGLGAIPIVAVPLVKALAVIMVAIAGIVFANAWKKSKVPPEVQMTMAQKELIADVKKRFPDAELGEVATLISRVGKATGIPLPSVTKAMGFNVWVLAAAVSIAIILHKYILK